MKTSNHSQAHGGNQARRSIKRILIAAGLVIAAAAPASAKDPVVDRESTARAHWRTFMAQTSAPAEGCFHVSYPEIAWQKVACKNGEPRARPMHAEPKGDAPEITGGIGEGNNDYVAEEAGNIGGAFGYFYTSGVLDELGISIYGNQGIVGPNEYSIQLNTNKWGTTSACAGHHGCHVWQQFLYATDYLEPGEAAVFIQYWLLDWGTAKCPTGYKSSDAKNCYRNSPFVAAPDVPATDLGNVMVLLLGTATAGGSDTVQFMYDSEGYSASYPDSVLKISSVWDKTEFNVFGNGGGARALFNNGASITVNLVTIADSESYAAPTCLPADGSSGESNNMTAGACTAQGGPLPQIYFTETN